MGSGIRIGRGGAQGGDKAARRLPRDGELHIVADRQVARAAAGQRGEVEKHVGAALARADETKAAAAVRRRLQRFYLRRNARMLGTSAGLSAFICRLQCSYLWRDARMV